MRIRTNVGVVETQQIGPFKKYLIYPYFQRYLIPRLCDMVIALGD